MNAHSQARLAEVIPALAEKIERLAALCEADDIFFKESATLEVTQGLRTWADQDALYAQGRTGPGIRVTNARGGYSWHCMGMACDVAPFVNDAQPDWNETHPIWAQIVKLGESVGLQSGTSWKDEPHFQLPGIPVDCPTDEDRDLFAHGGITAVWNKYS